MVTVTMLQKCRDDVIILSILCSQVKYYNLEMLDWMQVCLSCRSEGNEINPCNEDIEKPSGMW
jgi:hypothetical protein